MEPKKNPSGDIVDVSDENNVDDIPDDNTDKVDYKTYRKVLSEKKRLLEEHNKTKAELDKFQATQKEAEQKKLEEQGEFKKLLEQERSRSKGLEEKLTHKERQEVEAKKFGAVLSSLGGSVDKKFYPLIPYEDVIIDPTTGEVDPVSLQTVVDKIKTDYSEIIKRASGKSMPNNAPNGKGGITYEQWLKLPSDEMIKQQKNVIGYKPMQT